MPRHAAEGGAIKGVLYQREYESQQRVSTECRVSRQGIREQHFGEGRVRADAEGKEEADDEETAPYD
jgi:hypothetical protein